MKQTYKKPVVSVVDLMWDYNLLAGSGIGFGNPVEQFSSPKCNNYFDEEDDVLLK